MGLSDTGDDPSAFYQMTEAEIHEFQKTCFVRLKEDCIPAASSEPCAELVNQASGHDYRIWLFREHLDDKGNPDPTAHISISNDSGQQVFEANASLVYSADTNGQLKQLLNIRTVTTLHYDQATQELKTSLTTDLDAGTHRATQFDTELPFVNMPIETPTAENLLTAIALAKTMLAPLLVEEE